MRTVNLVAKLLVAAYVVALGVLGYASIGAEHSVELGPVTIPALPYLAFLGLCVGLGVVVAVHSATKRSTCPSCGAYAGTTSSWRQTRSKYAHQRVDGGRDHRYKLNPTTEYY